MDNKLQRILKFVEDRDWKQFHAPKDLAISLQLEASEVLEHFQWKSPEEIEAYIKAHKDDIADELVDVLYWVLLMSHYMDISLDQAFDRKMTHNEQKYPTDQAKGSHAKYTAYEKPKEN